MANDLRLVEKGLVLYREVLPPPVGQVTQQAIAAAGFRIFKKASVNGAGLGGALNELVVVEGNAQLLCQLSADFAAAAAVLPADGHHRLEDSLGFCCGYLLCLMELSRPFKALLGRDDGNDLVDDGSCRNSPLDDLGALRCRPAQHTHGNAGKDQGNARVGQ